MSTKYFNVKNGMTTGNVLVSEPNVSLGAVANLHITGGNSGYFLSTDGSGNLAWTNPAASQSVAPMPLTVDLGNTLTIQANYQGLYGTPITVDGTLVIEGILVDVSGQGAPGSNSQVTFNDRGDPGANTGFTFDKVSGNLNVPGSLNAGKFFSCAAYYTANLRYITGVLGQMAVLIDSSPKGMPVYWDATNNRWNYVYNNSAI